MKAKVLKKFKDKHTKEIYKAKDVIEVTQERFDEILKTGPFVKKVDDEMIAEETEPEEVAEETVEEAVIAPAQNEGVEVSKNNSGKNYNKEKNNQKD